MDRYLQLADLAASQWGMVTAAQARHLGVSAQQIARMNRNGMLQRLQHGVYRLAGVPHDPLADLRAAWLSLDPEITAADRLARPDPIGVVSHRSAARVHQLGDLDADINEFTVTAPKRTRHPDARIYKRDLTGDDWEVIGGLPTTTVATTIGNLAAAAIDGGHLAGIIRDAILHAKIGYADVATLLRPYAHEYGAPLGDGGALTRTLLSYVCDIPDEVLAGLDVRAAELGLSRVEYIRRRLAQDARMTRVAVTRGDLHRLGQAVAGLADEELMRGVWEPRDAMP